MRQDITVGGDSAGSAAEKQVRRPTFPGYFEAKEK